MIKMGLCKCPRKKVTSLFCFEHRVNVCDECILSQHPSCIVQSYLQWLDDSDYSPTCSLCQENLTDEDLNTSDRPSPARECVRLTCLDVFHWDCLNNYAETLPPTTAPAGYLCPKCNGSSIIPSSQTVSPIANALKKKMKNVTWGRLALGLPTSSHSNPIINAGSPSMENYVVNIPSIPSTPQAVGSSTPVPGPVMKARISNSHDTFLVDVASAKGGFGKKEAKKLDYDENKYQRRSLFDGISRWVKNRKSVKSIKRSSPFQRVIMILILGVLGLLTIIFIMSSLGHRMTDQDPMLDPMLNPNIHIQEGNFNQLKDKLK